MTPLAQLADIAARLLADCDERLDQRIERLAASRREFTAARRAAGALSGGSDALQAISETIAAQLGALANDVDRDAEEVAAVRRERRLLAKVVELLRPTGEPGRTPTASLVRPVVERIVRENDGLTYEEVYSRTRDALANDGVAATGLGLRVREALKAPGIESDDEGTFRLASTPTGSRGPQSSESGRTETAGIQFRGSADASKETPQ